MHDQEQRSNEAKSSPRTKWPTIDETNNYNRIIVVYWIGIVVEIALIGSDVVAFRVKACRIELNWIVCACMLYCSCLISNGRTVENKNKILYRFQ